VAAGKDLEAIRKVSSRRRLEHFQGSKGFNNTVDLEQSFTASVKIAGINPYVDVPAHVVEALGGGTKAAVLVKIAAAEPVKHKAAAPQKKRVLEKDAARLKTIGRLAPGDWFRTTLVPLQVEPARLYLDTWMRETAGMGVGDLVRVTLRLDRNSREIPLPGPLLAALQENAQARAAWEALAPSRRREILTYLNFLKTPEALERNVQKTVTILLSKSTSTS
jgi:hypothetical protein